MWNALLAAFALVLILEGILPFLSPERWREMFRRILAFTDGQLRFFGLSSMLAGLILLFVAKLF